MNEVAVIIPARNAAASLDAAVRSAAALDRLREIIVVDDGSTDATRHWEGTEQAGPRVSVIRLPSPGRGPSAARNAGAAATTAPVLLFLDADDELSPVTPDPRWRLIDSGADVAVGRVRCFAPDGAEIGDPFKAFLNGSYMITRAAFEAAGGFRPDMKMGEEVELLGRIQDTGLRIEWSDEVVLHYLLRPGSASARRADRASGLLAGLRATVERRSGGR